MKLALEERESVDARMRHLEFHSEIAAVERLIAQQALSWPEIKRLVTVPGVGLIGAASFITAARNPNRFLTRRGRCRPNDEDLRDFCIVAVPVRELDSRAVVF